MKNTRKNLFSFVNGSEKTSDKKTVVKPVEDIDELINGKRPMIFGEELNVPDEFNTSDNDGSDDLSVAEKLSAELSECQELADYSSLFGSSVFFSGIILDIEEISEVEDVDEERTENIVALKLRVYNEKFVSHYSGSSVVETDIYLYLDDMDSVDILNEFEVGDFVGFNGYFKDDLEIKDFYEEDDALDERMSPSDICWTSAFMMHKNFLDTIGIDVPEYDKEPNDNTEDLE